MSENASLELCNLVSSGMTLAQARAHLAKGDGHKGEAQAPKPSNVVTFTGVPETVEQYREALTSRGIPFHPKAKLETLAKTYKEKVLDPLAAQEEADRKAAEEEAATGSGTGGEEEEGSGDGHKEPGDGH